ncbi:MAG: alpha/beta hydrolase [Clostridia bacterium]|nr:alpha/beta hydrolase [Clostridia bacterium]
MSKKGRIIAICVLLVTIVVTHIATFFGAGAFICDYALSRSVPVVDKILSEGLENYDHPFFVASSWFENVPKKSEIKITSHDNLKLSAYQILAETQTSKWVVLMHGYRGKPLDMTFYASKFYEQGFNILIPWQRAHGESEGKFITMGVNEKFDLCEWTEMISKRDAQAEIVLFGVSMGAASVMMSTAENLSENVKVAVSDCGYSSVYDQFRYLVESYLGFDASVLLDSAQLHANKKIGIDFSRASSTDALSKCRIPTLFIHGTADDFVPFSMLDEIYDSAILLEDGSTKEKLVIDDAEHMLAASVAPEIYFSKVFEFVNKFVA